MANEEIPRLFYLRQGDEHVAAWGAQWPNGTVTVCWEDRAPETWDSFDDPRADVVKQVGTTVVWLRQDLYAETGG